MTEARAGALMWRGDSDVKAGFAAAAGGWWLVRLFAPGWVLNGPWRQEAQVIGEAEGK